jgi:hypothetical protein
LESVGCDGNTVEAFGAAGGIVAGLAPQAGFGKLAQRIGVASSSSSHQTLPVGAARSAGLGCQRARSQPDTTSARGTAAQTSQPETPCNSKRMAPSARRVAALAPLGSQPPANRPGLVSSKRQHLAATMAS